MPEIRLSGSEGGVTQTNASSLPLSLGNPVNLSVGYSNLSGIWRDAGAPSQPGWPFSSLLARTYLGAPEACGGAYQEISRTR